MALQTPTPPPSTANPGRPSRLRVQWRRLRFALRRDPLSSVTSPALAIRLADELLARTAIAQPDTRCGAVWPFARWRHYWTAPRRPAQVAESDGCATPYRRSTTPNRPTRSGTMPKPRATGPPAAFSCAQHFPGYADWNRASDTASPSRCVTLWPRSADPCTCCRNPGSVTSVSARIFRRRVPDSAPTRAPGGTSTTFRSVVRAHAA